MKTQSTLSLACLCCLVSIHSYADEFEQYREALRKAWEPFTHYSATIHVFATKGLQASHQHVW
ncbi:MAG: hypothetical protein ABIH23_10395 [bacterium]